MQTVAFLTLLLVASASAAPSQPEQVPQASPAVPVSGVQQQPQQHSHQQQHQAQQGVPVVISNSPVVQPNSVHGSSVGVEQPQQVHPGHHQQQVASYYAPAGLITVIGEQQGINKPQQVVRNVEQYGQPESASIPPNYKPFGSWGLYIGGNPADGYYTNYYKALSNSVDKQQVAVGEPAKPAVSQTAAFAPILKQASSSPYVGGDYYPFAYSPSDLNSGYSRVSVAEPVNVHSQVVSSSAQGQPWAQVYAYPSSVESNNYGVSAYADSYATKKLGAAYAQKEVAKEAPASGKGYQSRVYVYPGPMPVVAASAPVGPFAESPSLHQHAQSSQSVNGQHQHVVAYPVPVGSQIVGSQPGVDGAFSPYGVHAFTRYAVKPTVVNQDPSYYYSSNSPLVYKQQQQVYAVQPQQQQQQQASGASAQSNYPLSYYGYPLSQLHYSQGSLVPVSVQGESQHSPIQPGQVEGISEKSESEDKSSVVLKQVQKRA